LDFFILYIFTIWKCIAYNYFCRDGIYFDKILVSEYKLFKRSNKANSQSNTSSPPLSISHLMHFFLYRHYHPPGSQCFSTGTVYQISSLNPLVLLLFSFIALWLSNHSVLSVPDEGYWAYLMKVIECTWWRLLSVPDEGYWVYLMKVIERTWWRLLSVPDEGYWAYLMKVIERTWWKLLSVPDEGYWAYLMKVIECTWWRLFHKRVVHTKYDIYVCITMKWYW
jgi:hypothetical protein